MKSVVVVVLAACVAASAALKIVPLPKITEEERKVFLANADLAVDCIIKPEKGCHPYSYDVHRLLPELIMNGFKCNCDAQIDVNLFQRELQKRKNRRAYRRLAMWVNSQMQNGGTGPNS